MSEKTIKIIGWVLAGLVAFIFIGSAAGKFMATPESIKMAEGMGLTGDTMKILGVIEILSAVLFIIPRTGVVGTLLLAAYMGGAIATHLEHGQSLIIPAVIEAFVWIAAVVRFPELGRRLAGKM